MSFEAPTWQEVLKQTLSSKTDYSVAFALATTRADGRPNVRHVGLKDVISLPASQSTNGPRATSSDASTTPSSAHSQSPVSALLFTTDVRSPKCQEIKENSACSLSTWLPETGVQFRIDGHAYLYRPQRTGASSKQEAWIHPVSSQQSPQVNLKAIEEVVISSDLELLSRALFNDLSPRTRAWHSRGVPGGRISDFTAAERDAWLQELEAGQKAEFEAAARNFALLLVVPYEVDVVQIVNKGNDKRWRWMLQGDLSWSVEELVP